MAHPRKRIRTAFKTRLASVLADGAYWTRAQGRVHTSRIQPVHVDELHEDGPVVLIYSRMEKTDKDENYGTEGDATYVERKILMVTEGMLIANELTVDDDLDDFAQEMEDAVAGFTIPGYESARIRLLETDIDVITEQVERPVGAIGLTWEIIYRTEWRPRASANNIDAVQDWLDGK
jgi:hypothetical protein